MEYKYTRKDILGDTLSIDNLIAEYKYIGGEKKLRKRIFDAFSKYVPDWDLFRMSRTDQLAAGKYSWFRNAAWGDGVFVRWDKFRSTKDGAITVPVLRLEINPNKHWDKPIAQALIALVRDVGVAGNLRKYDFAVDVPVRIEHVDVTSRKKTSVVKNTQYYGLRGKHGYLKVYDKKSELYTRDNAIDTDELTRLEWTFCDGEPVRFDAVSFRFFDSFRGAYGSLGSNAQMVANVAAIAIAHGASWDDIKPCINRATKEKIEPAVIGAHVRLCLDPADCYALVDQYAAEMNIAYRDEKGNWKVPAGFVAGASL